MKKLLNTLYVTTEGASLRKDGENVVAEVEGTERARVPFHMLASLVVFGAIYLSPPLIGALAAAGITIVLLDRSGRFAARIEGPVSGNVLLRRAQYSAAEVPEPVVRAMVLGKVANQRAVLMRALRDHRESMDAKACMALDGVIERLGQILRRVEFADDPLDRLRGAEGEAANLYFAVFGHLIRVPEAEMAFSGRSRRPPLDPANAVLSFLYTLLTHDCRSGAEAVGLDPAVGFLHRDRPGRPSLALDLMEEMRPVFADRLALSLINRRQLTPSHFERREGGRCCSTRTGAGSCSRRGRSARRRSATIRFSASGPPWVSCRFFRRNYWLGTSVATWRPTRRGSGNSAMLVLVTYDVQTSDPGGAGRLRRVARACQDFGQRVQYSVFEIEVDPAQWTMLRARLERVIAPKRDSLRYYYLGSKGRRRVEHVGAKAAPNLGGPLIV